MTVINAHVRETGEKCHAISGEFDGQTRAQALKDLLDMHHEEMALDLDKSSVKIAPRFVTAKRLAQILGFAA